MKWKTIGEYAIPQSKMPPRHIRDMSTPRMWKIEKRVLMSMLNYLPLIDFDYDVPEKNEY